MREADFNHRICVETLRDTLMSRGATQVRAEQPLMNNRADIYCEIRGLPVALEIQHSRLSFEELRRRTHGYARQNVAVLWLIPYVFSGARMAPKNWQRWLHALYFGRLYCWQRETLITPVHFIPYQLYVEERKWFSADGEQCAGGYHYRSRRYEHPKPGPTLDLLRDFGRKPRVSWERGRYRLPGATLFADIRPAWWAKDEEYYEGDSDGTEYEPAGLQQSRC
jgi:competence protein CoiA